MEVNNHIITEDIYNILLELRKQLELKGIKRFDKFVDSGNNIMTCCPFHKDGQERKPSFGIHKKDGTCHCFGCGWAGSFSEMVSNCFGYNDLGLYGSKWLIRNFLTIQIEERENLDLDFERDKKENIKEYISEEELDSYRYIHPYMYKRRLTDEIIELFDIGYDKNTGCITFPVRDVSGNTLFIARRSVNTKYFNYPAGVDKPVYGLYEYNKHQYMSRAWTTSREWYQKGLEIIICESMLDALTCWVYGKYAVALNGLGNDLQFKQLNSMPCRKFILATDMDEAGLKARKRLKTVLNNKIATEYRWDLNIAKDINDMSKEYFDELKEFF